MKEQRAMVINAKSVVRGVIAMSGLLLAVPHSLSAQEATSPHNSTQADYSTPVWTTLGTRGGPLPTPTRSQPANLLQFGSLNILVDAGDGVTGQLSKAGLTASALDAVFLSHLHFDHTGGLFAILGQRLQTNATKPLQIYGPPGTADTVRGLLGAMTPGAEAGYGVAGEATTNPADLVEVIDLRDGSDVRIGNLTVNARNNSHYSFASDSPLAGRFESLSFRFDTPAKSIVYTGDTGPSEAVVELAQGADLLVAEMMDVDHTIELVRAEWTQMPQVAISTMESHLSTHHLTPAQVGEMANRAHVGAVVVTHFVGREQDDPGHLLYLQQIRQAYDGPVVLANDMERF